MPSIATELRERALDGSQAASRRIRRARLRHLQLSAAGVESVHAGGLTWLALDRVEQRYLLASATDGSVAAYDTALPDGRRQCLFTADRRLSDGHKYSVSGVTWYPVDTGLFVTGSLDQAVKVWDTNALQVACSFALPAAVHAVAMSSCATAHCLVAACAADPEVRLCDPNSGSLSHTLIGHRDKAWAVAWSLTSEWQLVSGGCDGQVMLWDIRAAGCVHSFDHYNASQEQAPGSSQSGRRLAGHAPAATAHEGSVTAVVQTPDSLHWVTGGTDSRVRLWDSWTNRNKLVNYRQTANRAAKGRQLAVADCGGVLFHPSGSIVQAFEVHSGRQLLTLKAHMDAVNACCWNEAAQELYTGGNDRQICTWRPALNAASGDEDRWSS